MGDAEEFQAEFGRVELTSPVRIRKGQLPIGKGELAVHGGVIVLTLRGKERMRAPFGAIQRSLAPMFADEALRVGRRWVPRQRYRLTFVDVATGAKDAAAESRWGELFSGYETKRKRLTAVDRVERTAQAAAGGVLRDRAWRRTGTLRKEHGMLQLADGDLKFVTAEGETFSTAMADVESLRTSSLRSGRMAVKTSDGRQVFGFEPGRLPDGTWEKGEIVKQNGGTGTHGGEAGLADLGLDINAGVATSQDAVDAYQFASGLEMIGVLAVLAFEGHYTRRVRRRDWKRVLRNELSPRELLNSRAEEASAALAADDLLQSRVEAMVGPRAP
jgi:hypothetical protein